MAEASSRALFTGAEVLDLRYAAESDDEDLREDGVDGVFFPGSDDELGFVEEEVEDQPRLVVRL